MEGGTREEVVKGRRVIGSLARIMRGRNVSMELRGGLTHGVHNRGFPVHPWVCHYKVPTA